MTLLGAMRDAYVKRASNGKDYIIFKGYARSRPNLSGTRYLAENPKVACFVVGSRDIILDAAKATRVAFVALDITRECLSDQFSLARLGVSVASDISMALIATGLGVAAGAIATGVIAAPAVLTFAIVVAVGFVSGMAITAIDSKFKLTERAQARMMAFEKDPNSVLYKAEHGAASAGRAAASVGRQAIDGARYTTDRVWMTVSDMLMDDGRSTADEPVMFGFMP